MPIKNCGVDLDCFKEASKDCSRAKLYLNHEGGIAKLTLRGLTDDGCKVSLKIEEISDEIKQDYPTESLVAKGKTLNCVIPIKDDYYEDIMNLEENIDSSCSGPIKDIMQGPLKDLLDF